MEAKELRGMSAADLTERSPLGFGATQRDSMRGIRRFPLGKSLRFRRQKPAILTHDPAARHRSLSHNRKVEHFHGASNAMGVRIR